MSSAASVLREFVPGPATRRLSMLMGQRETLQPSFYAAWTVLAARYDADDMEKWAVGVLALIDVNAGPSSFLAYWDVSKRQPPNVTIAALVEVAQAAANICRTAGAQAAAVVIAAYPVALKLLPTQTAVSRWWRMMENLSKHAPESVAAVASRTDTMLSARQVDAFESFIAAGLKAASGDKKKRLAFFTLEDAAAQQWLDRASGRVGFAETERVTKTFVTALWGKVPLLRRLGAEGGQTQQRRAGIAGPLIRLPDVYRGVQDDAARTLYKAAAAHAQAHLVLGGPRFVVGKLKPLQIVLVTLIEDARIEMLAMRQFPGLRRLWSPYHIAMPTGVATAPTLLARLARALFDPDYVDDDGFVAKGRRMFAEAADRIDDPRLSRDIGMLLGNDLGQMRMQFNAKTYVVEPIYRDDGLGLWDFGDEAPRPAETLDVPIDAMKPDMREDTEEGDAAPDQASDDASVNRAKPVASDQRGVVIATYPEWDLAHGVERPDWTTVREVTAKQGDLCIIDHALDTAHVLRDRIRRLVRGVRVGRSIRLKRQFDGHDLDIDAVLEAGIAIKTGQQPDPRVFRSSAAGQRDLAVLVLIDISESTRDRLPSGGSILDVERLAVAVLAEAMSTLGDPFCLLAFASNGRADVEMTAVKHFGEPYDRACVGRLAGLSSGLSTRLGAALRHAGATIGNARSFRKLLIVLTDGVPSDIDVADPQELVEDSRRAVLGLRRQGIDGYGVALDPSGLSAASRIFGRGNTMLVNRAEDLPSRLSELYFRLARR